MSKTIAIVGAGPGIGAAIAERFGAEGFKVALIARNPERLDALAAQLGSKGVDSAGFIADVLDRPSLVAALTQAGERFGGIDVLEYGPKPTIPLTKPRDMTVESAQLHIDLSLLGAVAAVQTVLPGMLERQSGALLFTTAVSAQYPVTFTASFGVAAGAALNYARVLHQDLKAEGVYAGIVSVAGLVVPAGQENGPSPTGLPLLTPEAVAAAHWKLYTERSPVEAIVGDGDKIRAMAGM